MKHKDSMACTKDLAWPKGVVWVGLGEIPKSFLCMLYTALCARGPNTARLFVPSSEGARPLRERAGGRALVDAEVQARAMGATATEGTVRER